MKIGDLVELSASARKTKWARTFVSKIGLIADVKNWLPWDSSMDTYFVHWTDELAADDLLEFKRCDIKYARVKK